MRSENRERKKEQGFTLVELLVVLVILALLAGIVAPRVTGYLGQARTGTARTQIEQLATAVELFNVDVGRYPTDAEGLGAIISQPSGLDGWSGPYLSKAELPLDPWKREYQYTTNAENIPFDIFTLGADNAAGGTDDAQDVRYATLRAE